tara:strand:+ start:503 stop:1720 length:1218 start_codon:yes stop_codon:yes gene_type:complete
MSNKKEGKLRSDGSPCETNEQCKSNICHNEVCISEEENEKIHNELNNDFFQMRGELENIINNSKSNKDEIESLESFIKQLEQLIIDRRNEQKNILTRLRKAQKILQDYYDLINNYDGPRDEKLIKKVNIVRDDESKLIKQQKQIANSINSYHSELYELRKKLKEKEELKKKYTREIGTILKDTSDTSKKYKELQKTKSNKKDKEENEICRICLGPILQNESYGVCPNAKCNTKFHKDCIEQFCISTDIKEKYDYNQEILVYGEDGFPIVDRNGYPILQPLDAEYYVEKKCPLCGESWEEFCKNYIKEEEEEFTDNFNFRPIPSTFMDLNRIAQANRSPSNFSHSPSSPFSVPSRSSSRSRYSTPNSSGFNSPIGSPTRKGGKKRRTKKRKSKRKKTKRKSYKKKI